MVTARVGMGGIVATYVVFAVRWRVLLSNTARVPVQHTFAYIMIGYLANAALPLRLGEVARAVLLGKRHGISASLVFGSVVLEQSLDVFVVLLLALGVSWLRDMPPVVRTGIGAFAGIGLMTLVSLVLLACTGTRFFGWLTTLSALAHGAEYYGARAGGVAGGVLVRLFGSIVSYQKIFGMR
jgi:uncharacterized protein (TIRG00374 family)